MSCVLVNKNKGHFFPSQFIDLSFLISFCWRGEGTYFISNILSYLRFLSHLVGGGGKLWIVELHPGELPWLGGR